jgi:hypothetical protein
VPRERNHSAPREHSHSAPRKHSHNAPSEHSRSVRRKHSHNAPQERNHSERSRRNARHSRPEGSRGSPLLATAAANMAAFLTPITVPISATDTPSTWGVPR